MQKPVQVTFHGLPVQGEVEAACLREAGKLERYCDHITGCRVTLSEPHRRRHKGNAYRVCVELALPGGTLVVARRSEEHDEDASLHLAIRGAFDAARRGLEDFVRRERGQVKHHEPSPTP